MITESRAPDLIDLGSVVLCDESRAGLTVHVSVEVNNGRLLVSGHDMGKATEIITGEDEYEYFYDFDQENTDRLFDLLTSDNTNSRNMFLEQFNGSIGCMHLLEFCKQNKIEFKISCR